MRLEKAIEEPRLKKRLIAERRGFVLPVVVFTLVLASTMMVAALLTADDETRSARAMRESSAAFYAAEAGLNEVYAKWSDIEGAVSALVPGTSLTLDWRVLDNGTKYRATIHRWDDNGSQPIYQLEVEGRGRGAMGSQRVLSSMLTSAPGGPGEGYKLGECCEAPVTVRGDVDMDDETLLDGHDANPPGWGDACTNELQDKPGIVMHDTTKLHFSDPDAEISGVPPIVQNPDLSDATWDSLGGLAWSDLKSRATKFFHDTETTPRPSTKIDPMTGELVCNTDDPLNLGSPDPNHPCFNYFPIVVIDDDVTFRYGYAQGIFILDWDPSTHQGSEFDLETDFTLAGIVLGRGCVEPEENSRTYGAMFIDGEYRNYDICNTDLDYDMNDGDATVQWSTCAVDRAIVYSGLDEWAEATIPGEPGGIQFLMSRSFGEVLR
jgi:Tfp pilus assembly protein PilX